MSKEKFPEIWAAMEKAKADLAPLEAERAEGMAKVDAAARKMDKLKAEKAAAHDEACANLDQIRNLRQSIARMANAMGATRV